MRLHIRFKSSQRVNVKGSRNLKWECLNTLSGTLKLSATPVALRDLPPGSHILAKYGFKIPPHPLPPDNSGNFHFWSTLLFPLFWYCRPSWWEENRQCLACEVLQTPHRSVLSSLLRGYMVLCGWEGTTETGLADSVGPWLSWDSSFITFSPPIS